MSLALNENAAALCQRMIEDAERLRVGVVRCESGATLLDCGIRAAGGLEAGRRLAEICLAGLGQVQLLPGAADVWPGPAVVISTDQPIAACMASQYAGWKVAGEKFFAMGSGPMRAAAASEELFQRIGHTERPQVAVGVLETGKLPPPAVCRQLAADCGVEPAALMLLVAPTASLAGSIQIAARSVETALHKLLELKFDLRQVVSGYGMAPLPPVAADDLTAIGRTNDAILYGSEVTLWVRGEDEMLASIGPAIPSSASSDYGQPFAEIFARYNHDFYGIDPHLFSPAVITLTNLTSGRSFRFGHTLPRVIHRSFMP